ncbi:hypothetical protein BGC33_03310, partial [Bathymodiolus thermophilus thioautotrophic gill symbiont]
NTVLKLIYSWFFLTIFTLKTKYKVHTSLVSLYFFILLPFKTSVLYKDYVNYLAQFAKKPI